MKIKRHCQYCGVTLPKMGADGKPQRYLNHNNHYFCDVRHHAYWAISVSEPVDVHYPNTIYPEIGDYPIVRGFI